MIYAQATGVSDYAFSGALLFIEPYIQQQEKTPSVGKYFAVYNNRSDRKAKTVKKRHITVQS